MGLVPWGQGQKSPKQWPQGKVRTAPGLPGRPSSRPGARHRPWGESLPFSCPSCLAREDGVALVFEVLES